MMQDVMLQETGNQETKLEVPRELPVFAKIGASARNPETGNGSF